LVDSALRLHAFVSLSCDGYRLRTTGYDGVSTAENDSIQNPRGDECAGLMGDRASHPLRRESDPRFPAFLCSGLLA
jgi:hypothetical protein